MKATFYTPFGIIQKQIKCTFDTKVEGNFSYYNCSTYINLFENNCNTGIHLTNKSIGTYKQLCIINGDVIDLQLAYYCKIEKDTYVDITPLMILFFIFIFISGIMIKYIFTKCIFIYREYKEYVLLNTVAPITKYDSNKEEECVICLEEYNKKEIIRTLKCKHFYHKNCIDKWMKNNNKCPLCKDTFIP